MAKKYRNYYNVKHTVKEVELSSGSKGLLIDVPGSSVMSYLIHFRAGNRYVAGDDIYETAHIMEHMAFGANSRFASSSEFSAEFEKNGAYVNASTGDIGMTYYADCAEIEWERILALQKTAITSPQFSTEELEAEAGNVHEELTGFLSSHGRVLWHRVAQAAGNMVMLDRDRLKTIPNITTSDITEHYKRTHTLRNMNFVVAGPLSAKRRKITDSLEAWRLPKGELLSVPRDELHGAEPVLVRRAEVPNLIFGFEILLNERLDDSSLDAMGALNHILTGSMHSRILGTARAKGLTYHMWSDTSAYDYVSEWSFGGQVSLEKAERLFTIIVEELCRVLDGKLTTREVNASQHYALGKHQMAAQTVAQIANWYSGRYFFDQQVYKFDYRPRAIRAVTKEKIVAVAQKFIEQKLLVLGGLGSVEPELLDKLNLRLQRIFG